MSNTSEKSVFPNSNVANKDREISPSDKWVTAVTDLIRLTQHGRIAWKKVEALRFVSTSSLESATSVETLDESKKAIRPFGTEIYEGFFGGQKLELIVMPEFKPARTNSDALNFFLAMARRNEKIELTVFKETGDVITQFPPIAPLRALVLAVESQIHREEDTFLQALHNAQ